MDDIKPNVSQDEERLDGHTDSQEASAVVSRPEEQKAYVHPNIIPKEVIDAEVPRHLLNDATDTTVGDLSGEPNSEGDNHKKD